jgi:hypothetical protein
MHLPPPDFMLHLNLDFLNLNLEVSKLELAEVQYERLPHVLLVVQWSFNAQG